MTVCPKYSTNELVVDSEDYCSCPVCVSVCVSVITFAASKKDTNNCLTTLKRFSLRVRHYHLLI